MLKQFIKKITFFLFILIALVFILIVSTEHVIYKNCEFKLDNSPKYVLFGHSHPECAYNDSLISSFKNLSQSGESYFYTFLKAKQIIKQNPSIEVVFIEFTNNQINKSIDRWIWNDKNLNYRYPTYAPFMDLKDNILLMKNNVFGYLNSNSNSLKYNLSRLLRQNFDYTNSIGGYKYLKRNKTDSLIRTLKESPTNKIFNPISENGLDYLSRLIKFCKEESKIVYLIRSPIHKQFPELSNEQLYHKIRLNRYSTIDYLDFSKFPLNNSEFGDLGHLNYRGARVFSLWFESVLNSNFINENNKQTLIDNKIEDFKRLKHE